MKTYVRLDVIEAESTPDGFMLEYQGGYGSQWPMKEKDFELYHKRKNLSFPEALAALLSGSAIRRRDKTKEISLKEGVIVVRYICGSEFEWVPLQEDMFKDDWEIIDTPAAEPLSAEPNDKPSIDPPPAAERGER